MWLLIDLMFGLDPFAGQADDSTQLTVCSLVEATVAAEEVKTRKQAAGLALVHPALAGSTGELEYRNGGPCHVAGLDGPVEYSVQDKLEQRPRRQNAVACSGSGVGSSGVAAGRVRRPCCAVGPGRRAGRSRAAAECNRTQQALG